jgi:hypothetical protein
MVCFRSRRLAAGFFVSVTITALGVLGACGGKKEEGKGAAEQGGPSATGNKDLDLIPVESDVVFGVNLAQAQKSAVFRDLVLPAMTRSADFQKLSELLKTKCNIDPMTAATTLTGGIRFSGSRPSDGVTVVHGIEKGKALPCLDQLKEELAAQQLEVAKDGDVVVIKSDRGDLAFTFTSDATAVIVSGTKATKAGVLEVTQGKSAISSSKAFTEMYGRVEPSHTMWAVARGDTEIVAKNLEKLNVKAKAIVGSVNATDGLELRAQTVVETEEQATNLAALMKSQAEMLSSMAEKVEITSDKNTAKALVVLTAAQLKTLSGFARSFLRGAR